MLVLCEIKELHKQHKITKKRQEVEHTACLQHKEEECDKRKEKERKDRKEKVWKEVEVKVQREKEEKQRWEHAEKEKEKEKVSSTSVAVYPVANWHLQEIIIIMLEDKAGSQPPKWRRRVVKKVLAQLAMEPCHCCLD